jgi:peptide/nickel transport system permease protein
VRRAAIAALGATLMLLLCAHWIAPFPYQRQFRSDVNVAPCRQFRLGTDALGRDRLSRLIYGGRISMVLAPLAALLAVALAVAAGLTAGCLGGWCERAVATATDLCLSLPWLFLLVAVRAMLPLNAAPTASIVATFALLGLLGWAGPSRITLAAVKRHLASDFVLVARSAGCPPWRIALVQVLPNLKPVAAAQFWVTAPAFLLAEANLGLLGLGVAEPVPSWGNLLREMENFSQVARNPWMAAPLVALVIVVSCFQLAISTGDLEA